MNSGLSTFGNAFNLMDVLTIHSYPLSIINSFTKINFLVYSSDLLCCSCWWFTHSLFLVLHVVLQALAGIHGAKGKVLPAVTVVQQFRYEWYGRCIFLSCLAAVGSKIKKGKRNTNLFSLSFLFFALSFSFMHFRENKIVVSPKSLLLTNHHFSLRYLMWKRMLVIDRSEIESQGRKHRPDLQRSFVKACSFCGFNLHAGLFCWAFLWSSPSCGEETIR